MYDYLTGKLITITPSYIVLDVQGLGFKIYAANPFQYTSLQNKQLTVYVHHAVREDSELLYGFKKAQERELFEQLLKVSGIGPKSALAIMATEDHHGLVEAIENSDIKYLTNFPGVGKKTAQQIVIDLQGKLEDFILFQDEFWDLSDNKSKVTEQYKVASEAKEALLALGYSERDIKRVEKVLAKDEIATTDEYLRKALKEMIS